MRRLELGLPRGVGRLARGERGLARLEPRLAVRVHLLIVLELSARLLQVALLLVQQRRRREATLVRVRVGVRVRVRVRGWG